jgi:hypothetical protein
MPRAGHGDVHQATFLLQLILIARRAPHWEDAVARKQ